jgi:hypothetical protein
MSVVLQTVPFMLRAVQMLLVWVTTCYISLIPSSGKRRSAKEGNEGENESGSVSSRIHTDSMEGATSNDSTASDTLSSVSSGYDRYGFKRTAPYVVVVI